MSFWTKRPGVYSEYTVKSRYAAASSQKFAAAVGVYTGENPEALYEVKSVEELAAALPSQGDAGLYPLCKILLEGGVSKVYCAPVPTGATAEDYKAAFARLEGIENLYAVVCDSGEEAVLQELRGHCVFCSERQKERLGFCGAKESSGAPVLAQSLGCERMVLCAPAARYGEGESAAFTAAAFAAGVLTAESAGYNLNGLALGGVDALVEAISESALEEMLGLGVCAFESVGGQVQCVKALTTRSMSGGAADYSLAALNTMLIIDEVMAALRTAMKQRLRGARNNALTRGAIASQATIELAAKQDEGLIDDFDVPLVSEQPDEPGVLLLEVGFHVAGVISQIRIVAQITV